LSKSKKTYCFSLSPLTLVLMKHPAASRFFTGSSSCLPSQLLRCSCLHVSFTVFDETFDNTGFDVPVALKRSYNSEEAETTQHTLF